MRPTRKLLLYSVVLIVTMSVAATPIAAQEGSAPVATLSSANIQVDAGETTQVTASYEFTVSDAGSGDQALSAISGTMWLFPDHGVSDVTATVNGESVDPTIERANRYMDVAIPVSDVSNGDTVEATVSYTVASTAGDLKAPIWTPEFQTTGTDRAVEMTVSLPAGSNVHGAAFPKVDSTDGTTLSYSLLHMPGFVTVEYGPGGGALLDVGTISTVAGLVFIFGILGGWLAWRRRAVREGGDASVI